MTKNMNLNQIIMGMTNYSRNGVNFILNTEEQKILLEYIDGLQQKIDKAIWLLDLFISDTDLSRYDFLKILMDVKKKLKDKEVK